MKPSTTARMQGLVVLLVLAFAGPATAHHTPEQHMDTSSRGWPIDDFSLTDQRGQTFTQESLRGRWTFVVIGDTQCELPCAEPLAALTRMYKRIAGTEALKTTQVLFVSLDPQRDTPARLQAYLAPYDSRFVAGTAPPGTLRHLVDDIHGGRQADRRGAGSLVLVGPDGTVRAEYLPPFEVELLTAQYLKTRVRK